MDWDLKDNCYGGNDTNIIMLHMAFYISAPVASYKSAVYTTDSCLQLSAGCHSEGVVWLFWSENTLVWLRLEKKKRTALFRLMISNVQQYKGSGFRGLK